MPETVVTISREEKERIKKSIVNAPLVSLYSKNTNNAKREVRFKQVNPDSYSVEAVQRYTDTSWQIHRQSKKKSSTIPINTSPSKNDDETKIEIVKTNGVTPNGDVAKPSENDRPESRQVVQIETVEVTYEPVKSQVEVVLPDGVAVGFPTAPRYEISGCRFHEPPPPEPVLQLALSWHRAFDRCRYSVAKAALLHSQERQLESVTRRHLRDLGAISAASPVDKRRDAARTVAASLNFVNDDGVDAAVRIECFVSGTFRH
ncbi:hypothetical protein GEV33_004312 [Tenebrio molitor]|uniref:Uncharacterized protein n=1 Tax=Tenebrio molitor TaxID=7067 RepID=A0A8J6HPQ6_TENMO|nr:hypothetical protein GEV33_004312 [Tenebrio molitor]